MAELLTLATFEPFLGKRFAVRCSDIQTVEVELIQAQALPAQPGCQQRGLRGEPFVLVFRGPREFVMPQRIYALHEETLGILEIFLVPVDPDETGQRYEAVFN